jgi:hypothetical protein
MFGILKKVFANSTSKPKKSASKSKISPSLKKKSLNSYFQDELNECEHIKPEAHSIVMKHLTQKINLNKTGNKLTAKEKKDLGINARLSVTHELIDVLTNTGQSQPDPKEVLSSIYYKATFAQNHDDSLNQYRKLGIKHCKIMGCNDERECDWCKSMDGKKLSIKDDINKLIKENCKCVSHCRLGISAVIQ